jgi:ribosome-associated protein
MGVRDEPAIEAEEEERPPSKSMRKREAHSLQKLGEHLVRMKPRDVATLPLSEQLFDAITEARRLTSHGALSRQHQYIGKLMRDIDIDELEAALARLEVARNPRARLPR